MIILGISCFYHDASACIVKDGKVIAAVAQERFSRIKHDLGFPKQAITFCLDALGIAMNEVDVVAFYEKPIVKFERFLSQHLEHFPKGYKTFLEYGSLWANQRLNLAKLLKEECHYHGRIVYLDHHLSHAASAVYLSPFKESVILTLDGVGEWTTTSLGRAQGLEIQLDQIIRFPHSLGLLYSAITTFLGFKANNDEYKIMGLAAYGNPKPFKKQLDKLITVFPDASYRLAMDYFDFAWRDRMHSQKLERLLKLKPRNPESQDYSVYADLAAALQIKLEEVVFSLLRAAYKKYRIPHLCLAGGVALNSVLNGKILSKTPFKDLYIPPDPGDGGGSMGAALYAAQVLDNQDVQFLNRDFYPALGPQYADDQIKAALDSQGLTYTFYPKRKKFLQTVAQLLADEKIIGWFQGRMEWGPRALGYRSILASAATREMKDIINAKVKHREMFRPFAPVILEEYVQEYFHADQPIPKCAKYMLIVYPFKKKGIQAVPATVHEDKTGRLQTLAREDNPLYYDLIEAYRCITGVPIIINTSFNSREPIICTPKEAIDCFLRTDIDYLVLNQYLVAKTHG